MASSEQPASGQPAPGGQAGQPAPAVDVQQLAERVYRLMLAELRLEQARGQRGERRKDHDEGRIQAESFEDGRHGFLLGVMRPTYARRAGRV